MYNILVIIILFLISLISSANAYQYDGGIDKNNDLIAKNNSIPEAKATKFLLYAEHGIRIDDLKWSVGRAPNFIISELSWTKLNINQTKVGAYIPLASFQDFNIPGEVFLHGYYAGGDINSGQNQDSDYGSVNRGREFSRSYSDAGSGSVRDYSLNLSYRMPIDDSDNLFVAPMIGYSANHQNLRMTGGVQDLADQNVASEFNITVPAVGSKFSNLNSTYDAEWSGIFIGVTADAYLTDKHQFELTGEYHVVDYYAQGNWNLRSDLQHPKSFEHKASGDGKMIGVKYKFRPYQHILLSLAFDYRDFVANNGTDKTFTTNGKTSTIDLIEVGWRSKSAMAGISYLF